jgi:hypothetical protein
MSQNDGAWAQFVKRHRNGETNKDVSRKVGADASTVGRWVKGQTEATPQQAINFARAYGLHPVEALVAAGHLSPSDVEGRVTIETSATLEAFSTRALISEVSDRLEVMATYAGWIKAMEGEPVTNARMSDQTLRYLDPATPPNETDPESFKQIFGENIRAAESIDGVPNFEVVDVRGADDDEDHHTADLTKEAVDLAASEDDTVVDPDR